MPMGVRSRLLLLAERSSLLLGLVGVVWIGALQLVAARETQLELERFVALRVVAAGAPDQSLWAPDRVRAWREALRGPAPPPLAVLRIPSIGLEVPVLSGTDDRTLDRGVGHVEYTAQPGTDGNL